MSQSPTRVFRPLPATRQARLWFFILLAALGLPLLWLLFAMLRAPSISYRMVAGRSPSQAPWVHRSWKRRSCWRV